MKKNNFPRSALIAGQLSTGVLVLSFIGACGVYKTKGEDNIGTMVARYTSSKNSAGLQCIKFDITGIGDRDVNTRKDFSLDGDNVMVLGSYDPGYYLIKAWACNEECDDCNEENAEFISNQRKQQVTKDGPNVVTLKMMPQKESQLIANICFEDDDGTDSCEEDVYSEDDGLGIIDGDENQDDDAMGIIDGDEDQNADFDLEDRNDGDSDKNHQSSSKKYNNSDKNHQGSSKKYNNSDKKDNGLNQNEDDYDDDLDSNDDEDLDTENDDEER